MHDGPRMGNSRTYRLRAYDAVQLAAALALQDEARICGVPGPTFVCADTDILGYASSQGVNIENPNTYH